MPTITQCRAGLRGVFGGLDATEVQAKGGKLSSGGPVLWSKSMGEVIRLGDTAGGMRYEIGRPSRSECGSCRVQAWDNVMIRYWVDGWAKRGQGIFDARAKEQA